MRVTPYAAIAVLLAVPPAAASADAASCPLAAVPRLGTVLAHPVVSGPAGPFAIATVVLDRPSDPPDARFDGRLISAARCLTLAGPPEPGDFFVFTVRSVFLTPIDTARRNGVVVLYEASQIGPQHETETHALVYRITATAAVSQPALERWLSGATTAADARRRLQRANRR